MNQRDFIIGLPKAELHLHLEGSLEPELLMQLAERNQVDLPYASVEEVHAAYQFKDLQDFLNLYYQGMGVLRTHQDFHDLASAYMDRIAADGVVHTEVFYDPQGHTERGVSMETCTDGLISGLEDGARRHGLTYKLILCFLRHLPEDDAIATFHAAKPWFDDGRIIGVGLDSSEKGNPPEKFQRVFALARDAGLKIVAHAGEEGPAAYVWGALNALKVDRIDHGNAALQDADLVTLLTESQIALTVCPLSNLKLRGVEDMADHPLKIMLDQGLNATVNSDDPAYFGGYVVDNYVAVADALNLSPEELITLAYNSLNASFLDDAKKAEYIGRFEAYVTDHISDISR